VQLVFKVLKVIKVTLVQLVLKVLKVTRVIRAMMPLSISSRKLIMTRWPISPASILLRGD